MRGYPPHLYSQFFLNGHLCKTDTSQRRTHLVLVPVAFQSFCCNYTLLYGMKIPQNGNAGALHDSKLQTL